MTSNLITKTFTPTTEKDAPFMALTVQCGDSKVNWERAAILLGLNVFDCSIMDITIEHGDSEDHFMVLQDSTNHGIDVYVLDGIASVRFCLESGAF